MSLLKSINNSTNRLAMSKRNRIKIRQFIKKENWENNESRKL